MAVHPLSPLTKAELEQARDIVKLQEAGHTLFFRSGCLQEPVKSKLVPFLQAEHEGRLTNDTPRPPRLALLHMEFGIFQDACVNSQMFKDAMAEFAIPEHFVIAIDPWPYGGPDPGEDVPRVMQGLVFARDTSNKNADSNYYGNHIPITPVVDLATGKVIRIDRLATGGEEDGIGAHPRQAAPKPLFENVKPAEYIEELLDRPLRTDMKPINITQPEGASFTVHTDNLVEWQKWRFRLGFTPREGAVLHDLCYDNRPILYRLSYSELTVPYADPRPPFHRKQAFDLGDGGFGLSANSLELGCDCLGAIHYFDNFLVEPSGDPKLVKATVCLHEQDNGIGWKHTNYRTKRAVAARHRELVVQCAVTMANYVYVFAYKLDTAGGVTIETRATGIMSVVGIDAGKTSRYGNVVAPGVLAQNHQHMFAVRIDPAIDSYADGQSRVVVEESVPVRQNPATNPFGNYYEVRKKTVERACWVDAEPKLNRVIRLENATKKNDVSGRNHHAWVTGYREGELWAAGEFTNQSLEETGGVYDMVKRGDWFSGDAERHEANGDAASDGHVKGRLSSPVLWAVFGLTHNPRVEDWPVMPVEIHHLNLRPADFFTSNPALDVPTTRNQTSVTVGCCSSDGE
ncbi:hypothetical protein VdG1_06145 [Verticillium dahliae VDG1]|nr:hypothetical protein VdG1_06145 [Verticillium dahliae VDG1]